MKYQVFTILLIIFLVGSEALCETVKDREGSVRNDRAKMENNTRWIYSDIDKGFEEAKKSGKPLMVVLRCVPCLACMGIDTQVLTESVELTPLMNRFVRVRVINANALELSLFQFDYDLSFTTLFFNGDGTVYGRYGSWSHQKDSQNRATASFKHALEGALRIHQNYPANKASLAGKQGKPSRFKTPIDMPRLKGKYRLDLNWNDKVVQSCVHCHMIGDAIRHSYRDSKQVLPDKWIYSFPPPDTIGIQMAEAEPWKIEALAAGSSAAVAGLKTGDEIVSLSGQPLISTADFSWVLHNSPDSGVLSTVVKRDGKDTTINIELPAGWRTGSDISDRVGTWPMRAMAFGGMLLVELSERERNTHKLASGVLALYAKHVGQYGIHAAAKREGFRKGDIIVEIAGSTKNLTESELIGRLIQNYKPGQKVPVTVLRKGIRKKLKIPVQ